MKLQFASDLHLEFPENREFIHNYPLRPEGDMLILAGDIVSLDQMHIHADFFDYISDNFKLTYWIPGNHEFYHSDISDIAGKDGFINEKIKENIFLVNNTSVISGNCKLLFSTLWTRISRSVSFFLESGYPDFSHILKNMRRIDTDEYNHLHEESVSFLKKELQESKSKHTIIITHHMPTFRNYPEEFRGNIFNELFAVELEDFITEAGPDYWIFGHHHSCRGEFRIDKTQLCSNPLGYIMYNEQKGFDAGKILQI